MTEQRGFSPRAVAILLFAGLVGFVGFGVLTAFAPALEAGSQSGGNALSRSAVGYAGLVRLLRAEDVPVVISQGRLPAALRGSGLLVLTPPAGTKMDKALAPELVRGRRTLVILPKWNAMPDPDHPGWATKAGLVPLEEVTSAVYAAPGSNVQRRSGVGLVWLSSDSQARLPVGRTEAWQTHEPGGAEVVLSDDRGLPVLIRVDDDLYALSDPDLMDNQGLASLDTARTAVGIINRLRLNGGPVVFDVTLNGLSRAHSLLGLALTPPFLGASICALAAALLMGAHAAARFGPARPELGAPALGKASLLDNSAMLIHLARREPRMGVRYAALIRRTLARRVLGAGASLVLNDAKIRQLDEALDRLTRPGETCFSALAGEMHHVRDNAALMRAVGLLYQIRSEILGERH